MQRLAVGRTPLRDALQRLAHERFVEILPRRGTFVTEVTVGDLQQIFEVAWALQGLLARRAVDHCTAADLADLERLIELQAAVPPEQGSTTDIESQVFRLLLRLASNDYLTEVYRSSRDASLRLLYVTRCGRESHAEQRCFLRAVADALAERDAEHLADVLRDQLRSFRERVAASIFSPNGRLSA